MRDDAPDCPRCGHRMARGFLLDAGHHDVPRVPRWAAGAPVRSFWTGLEVRGRQVLAVVTYRCTACGYLESYAPADGAAGG